MWRFDNIISEFWAYLHRECAETAILELPVKNLTPPFAPATSISYKTDAFPLPSDVTAADLHPCTIGNRIFKYADDTYLVVPATNSITRCLEIEHIGVWAEQNNLTMNCGMP